MQEDSVLTYIQLNNLKQVVYSESEKVPDEVRLYMTGNNK